MVRIGKFIRMFLAGTLLLSLLAGIFGAKKQKRAAKSVQSSAVKKHSVKKSPEETLKYWTAEKMRNAQPAPMPHIKDQEHEK